MEYLSFEIKIPAFAALFLHQMNPGQDHAFVNGLAHIIDGEKRHAGSCEGFHLHTGPAFHLYRADGCNGQIFPVCLKIHTAFADQQRVAHGYQR